MAVLTVRRGSKMSAGKIYKKCLSLLLLLAVCCTFPFYSQNYAASKQRPVFTAAEQDFIARHFLFTVGVPVSRRPISFYDRESRCFSGIQCDFIRKIAELSGLNFVMVPLADNESLTDALKNNRCDLVFGVPASGEKDQLIKYTYPYRMATMKFCIKKDRFFSEKESYTIAVGPVSDTFPAVIAQKYQNWTIGTAAEEDLADMVSRGKSDLAAADEYVLRYQLQIPHNENVRIVPDYLCTLPLCAAVSAGQPSFLLSVINKTVAVISQAEKAAILKKNSGSFVYQYSFHDVLYGKRFFIFVTLTLTSLVVFLGFALLIRQKKTKETLTRARISAEAAVNGVNSYLSALSHEIRTPLNVVIELAELSLHAGTATEKQFEYNKKILYSSRILLGAVNAVFDLSVSSSYRLPLSNIPFSLKVLASAVAKMCYADCQHKGIIFELSLKNVEDEVVIGDSNLVKQVLVNLAANAVRFTPEKSKISICFEQQKSTASDKVFYRFNVISDGFKLSEEMCNNLFTSFDHGLVLQNAEYKETGLVFSIVKYFVDSMKGNISVKSVAGKNVVFCIDLPFYRPGRSDIAEASNSAARLSEFETAARHFKPMSIVISGTDKNEAASCTKICEKLNIKCIIVDDPDGLPAELARADLRGVPYRLCMLDYASSGNEVFRLTQAVRSINLSQQPEILVIAYDSDEISANLENSGINYVIKKPLFPSSLFKIFLSLQPEKMETVSSDDYEQVFDFSDKKILAADDSELNLEVLKNLLQVHGAAVVGVESGKQVLDIFSKSAVNEYNFILLDKNMPVLNGLNTAALIRKMERKDAAAIPLFIISADVFSTDSEKFSEYGIDGFLAKPIDPQILFRTLAGCFAFQEKIHGGN
jgi:signal transduction histidine kinase/CheY-like chemotaxis protein